MTEVAWESTAAGLVRNGGLAVTPDAVAKLTALMSPDRTEARKLFRESHAAAIAIGEALRDQGWPGSWIHVASTVPPELAPLYAGQLAAQARLTAQSRR